MNDELTTWECRFRELNGDRYVQARGDDMKKLSQIRLDGSLKRTLLITMIQRFDRS